MREITFKENNAIVLVQWQVDNLQTAIFTSCNKLKWNIFFRHVDMSKCAKMKQVCVQIQQLPRNVSLMCLQHQLSHVTHKENRCHIFIVTLSLIHDKQLFFPRRSCMRCGCTYKSCIPQIIVR